MADTFKAVCKKTKHGFRGSQQIPEPSFIEGKTYEFTRKTFAVMYHGLGDFSTVNERGLESIMDEKHFNKYFERADK